MEINAAGVALGAPGSSTDRGLATLSSEDFFKILVTELQSQDPFEPADTGDMIGQVSEIRSIELSGRLNDTLEALTAQQRVNGSSDLIGKFVSAEITQANGATAVIEGIVTGVRFTADGTALLELDTGDVIRSADIVRITSLEALTSSLSAADELLGDPEDESVDPEKAAATQRSRGLLLDRLKLNGSIRI